MTKDATVYLFGVDTLIVNAKFLPQEGQTEEEHEQSQTIPDALEEQLAAWFEQARTRNEPYMTPWLHEGQALLLAPQGTANYRYLLNNGSVDVMIGPRLHNGAPFRVRFLSEYLWRGGVDLAVVNTHAFLMELVKDYLTLQVAELHLCADVTGLPIPKNYERVFVCRSRKERPVKKSVLDSPVYYDHRLETIQFAGHGSPLSATIYDKPAEIEQKRPEKRWFYDLWRLRGFSGVLPERSKDKDQYGIAKQDTSSNIWRVECRLKRQALHEMKIEDVYTALNYIASLWAYCVGYAGEQDGWLRMVVPNTRDSNRWRWKTAPSWQVVQQASQHLWRGEQEITALQRKRIRDENLDRAEKAIAGYTTTYGAWLRDEVGPDDDASIVLHRLYEKMQEIWEKKGVDFQTLREKKKVIYHIA